MVRLCSPRSLPDVSPYRPKSAAALSLSLGSWAAAGEPDLDAYLIVDPRLFDWIVNQASRRTPKAYRVNFGKPALTVELN